MNKLKFYKGLAVGLLLLNIAMVLTFFVTRPPHNRGGGRGLSPNEFFDFDKVQHDQFLVDVNNHHEIMQRKKERKIQLLKPYFNSLVDSSKKGGIEEILKEVQSIEKERIEELYRHLEEIRDNLTDEQKPKFEEFLNSKIENILSGGKRRKSPRMK